MSSFSVPVVRIDEVAAHPNADSLSITHIDGCPVIFRTADFARGDLAIYVPVDAVVPLSNPAFTFLSDKEGRTTARIKAKRLRGVFSMGLLVPLNAVEGVFRELAPDVAEDLFQRELQALEGHDVSSQLSIVKYEEPEPAEANMKLGARQRDKVPPHTWCPVYDIESYRKYKRLLVPGELVVVTEKIHGCNARFTYRMDEELGRSRLYASSHRYFSKETEGNVWWKVARALGLEDKLSTIPNLVLYGEVYGQVQDLKYGTTPNDPVRFRAFDLYDLQNGRWLGYDEFLGTCKGLEIPTVPELYRGPYKPEVIEPLCDGKSVLADQIREGFVLKPVQERQDDRLGRVIMKLVGEAYHLRKNGTEHH